MRKKKRLLPWWLRSREECCTGCADGYAYAVEVRCVGCDGPFCPLCVVFVVEGAFCKECQPKGGSKWRRARSGKA